MPYSILPEFKVKKFLSGQSCISSGEHLSEYSQPLEIHLAFRGKRVKKQWSNLLCDSEKKLCHCKSAIRRKLAVPWCEFYVHEISAAKSIEGLFENRANSLAIEQDHLASSICWLVFWSWLRIYSDLNEMWKDVSISFTQNFLLPFWGAWRGANVMEPTALALWCCLI